MSKTSRLSCALLVLACTVRASEISQWRGPNRDGTYIETGLLTKWPDKGPPLLWLATGIGVEMVWQDAMLDCHIGGVVRVGNYIYGSNWLGPGRGNWACIEWQTGKTMYEKPWKTKVSIISADGLLYCYEERTGQVALVEATPNDFSIVSTFRITQGSGRH